MAEPEPETPEKRKKRTRWLLIGGGASLFLPLAAVIYLHISENSGAPGPSGRSDLFERRDGSDQKITPAQTVVPPSSLMTPSRPAASFAEKPGASSLDFIKSNEELRAKMDDSQMKPAPAAALATAPAVVAASTATAKAKSKPPKGKKDFVAPKLQPTKGFGRLGGNAAGTKSSPGAGANPQDLLKNLPPDAQQYLQKQQGQ